MTSDPPGSTAALPPVTAALPPVTAARLGPTRAGQALAVRARLGAAGLTLPPWVDRRPGLLQVVIADCAGDPPLSQSTRALALQQGRTLLLGLGAAALAGAAPRTAVVTRDADVAASLRAAATGTRTEVHEVPAMWPSLPELDVPDAAGHAWVVPGRTLHRLGALLSGQPESRLCTVAGAVRAPQVVPLTPARAAGTAASAHTPRELIHLCGGTDSPAWGALVLCRDGTPSDLGDLASEDQTLTADPAAPRGQAPIGVPWDPDAPVPAAAELVLILPARHPLLLRPPVPQVLARVAAVCGTCRLCSDACPAEVKPHAQITLLAQVAAAQVAAKTAGRPAMVIDPQTAGLAALGCTGCMACDTVCPAALGPSALVLHIKDALWESGARVTRPAEAGPAPLPVTAGLRRLPLQLVAARLGLSDYYGSP